MKVQNSLTILKELSSLTILTALASIASYSLTLVLVNYLGPSDFGLYSYCLLLGNFFSMFTLFSTDLTAPAHYIKIKDKQKLFNSVYSTRIVLFAISIFLIPFFYFKDPIIPLGILAILISIFNFSFFYEISGKNINYSKIYFFERLTYVLIVSLMIAQKELSILMIFLTLIFVTFISIIIQGRRFINTLQKFTFFNFFQNSKFIFHDNIYLLFITISTFMYGGFSRIILESKFGMEELGVYSAGWQIILIISIFQSQVTRVWRTKISNALINKNKNEFIKLVKNYFLLSTLPILIFTIFICLFSYQIVTLLFNNEYILLVKLLPIFSLFFVFINLESLSGILWISIGNKRQYLIISLLFSFTLIAILQAIPNSSSLEFFALITASLYACSVITLLFIFCYKYLKRI